MARCRGGSGGAAAVSGRERASTRKALLDKVRYSNDGAVDDRGAVPRPPLHSRRFLQVNFALTKILHIRRIILCDFRVIVKYEFRS